MEIWIPIVCLAIVGCLLYPILRKSPPSTTTGRQQPPPAQPEITNLSCTCAEWRAQRIRFRQGDPRRLCEHLCTHLGEDILRIPENLMPFGQLISRMAEEHKGMPYLPPTFAFVLGDTGYVVTMLPAMRPWTTVFVGKADYAFNIDTGHWGDSGRPPFASDIGNLIQAEIRRRTQEAPAGNAPAEQERGSKIQS